MKIHKLKINAFGNIENKEIELSEGINVVYGKNEAGKSTLLKFIVDTFYGISKNKRGKDFSDYERFKPWKTEEFSGKIAYSLDNGKKYEVYRDFNKKNPIIYDEELNDVSKDYTIDKTIGNLFFAQQTNVDENIFLTTLCSIQKEVKLEKQDQNVLVQKIANLASSGEDNVSYKKAIEKINKRQVEEIGTARTSGRPINIIKNEKYKLQDEIGDLEEYKDKKYEIEKFRQDIQKQIQENEEKLNFAKELKKLDDKTIVENQKVGLYKDIVNSNNSKIDNLKKEIDKKNVELSQMNISIESKDNKKIQIIPSILCFILVVIFTILAIILKNNQVVLNVFRVLTGVSIFSLLFTVIKYNNDIKKIKKKKEEKINIKNRQIQEIQSEVDRLKSQIELLTKDNEDKQIEIENKQDEIEIEIENQKKNVLKKYQIQDFINTNISNEIENIEKNITDLKVKQHELEIDKNNIIPKIEKLAQMEEELEELNQKEDALLKENESIELAKEVLEIAYKKMKENVTPKFTEELSKNIEKISNNKYKNVRINDEQGIIVEKENGEYVSCEKLSVGTIDQLYMSLRFGAIKEFANENMPIILDESFAYYDDERLENILKYIDTEFNDKQVIIFTCTQRENKILDKLNINHKEILL